MKNIAISVLFLGLVLTMLYYDTNVTTVEAFAYGFATAIWSVNVIVDVLKYMGKL